MASSFSIPKATEDLSERPVHYSLHWTFFHLHAFAFHRSNAFRNNVIVADKNGNRTSRSPDRAIRGPRNTNRFVSQPL